MSLMRQGDGLCRIGAGSNPLDAGMERAGMSTADSCRLLALADMVKHKAAGGFAVGLATPFPHLRGRAEHRLKDRRTRAAIGAQRHAEAGVLVGEYVPEQIGGDGRRTDPAS